jgi:hypothetical protein
MLVYCSADVAPDTVDLGVGLVHEPAVTNGVAARTGCVDQ